MWVSNRYLKWPCFSAQLLAQKFTAKLLLLLLQLRVTITEPKTKEVTKGRNSQTTSLPPLECRKRPNSHKKPILFLCAEKPPKTGKKEETDLVQRRRRETIKPRHTQVCTDELDLNKKGHHPSPQLLRHSTDTQKNELKR